MSEPRPVAGCRGAGAFPSPFSRWAGRAAACSRTGSSRSRKRKAGRRNRLRCPASRSAPARRSITSRWRRRRTAREPVFALMPTPGDVDIVMASELMEAGRSVLRGLVTPERTTLIASTHRAFAVVEKQAPGDGVADPGVVSIAAEFAAKRVIAFDMEAMAKANGSVISATMFGALAATGAPAVSRAPRSKRRSAPAARASRRACAPSPPPSSRRSDKPDRADPALSGEALRATGPIRAGHRRTRRSGGAHPTAFPREAQPMLFAGVAPAGRLSRSRLCARISRSRRHAPATPIARTAARRKVSPSPSPRPNMWRSRWPMTTSRASPTSRFASRGSARVRREVDAAADTIVATTEYFHPRAEELCGSLPKAWGEWIEGRPGSSSWLRPRRRSRAGGSARIR